MNTPLPSPNSSTLHRSAEQSRTVGARETEEDFAIGCECADPALQIEDWPTATTAQNLQEFN